MDALACMEVSECTGDVRCKRDAQLPGERLGFVVNIQTKVPCWWEVDKILSLKQVAIMCHSPHSINSEIMNIRPSGSGARDRPR